MHLRLTFSALAIVAAATLGGGAVARATEKCGAHQHIAVEKDEDEGGTVKRCVCDDGWNAGGPTAPCKKVGAAKKPKS